LSEARRALADRASAVAEAEAQLDAEDPTTVDELLRNARAVKSRLADERHDNDVKTRELVTKLAVKVKRVWPGTRRGEKRAGAPQRAP